MLNSYITKEKKKKNQDSFREELSPIIRCG